MEVKYKVFYLEEVVRKHIPQLSSSAKVMIQRMIEERLIIDPIRFGKPLRYSFKGHRRIRVSDYRVVYRIDQKLNAVTIVAIKHRKEIYQDT